MFGFLGGAKFLTSKPFIGGMVGLVILASIFFAYKHYTGLLDRVETLVATQTVLQTGLDIERQTVVQLLGAVDSWEASQDELLGTIEEMQENAHAAREENRNLRELFAEIDLGSMAPAAADSIVNSLSDRLWNGIGAASDPSRHSGSDNPAGEAGPPGPGPDPGPPGGLESN